MIGLALRRMDTNVQQHALVDGALWRITFRQLLGPIIASAAIVTIMASQEFGVYEPCGISVVATEVRMVFFTGSLSSPNNSMLSPMTLPAGERSPEQAARAAAAVAATLPLMACTVLLAGIAIYGARLSSASDSVTIGRWPRSLDAPWWVGVLTLALLLLNVGVPVWALVHSMRVPFSIPEMFHTFAPNVRGAIFVGVVAALLAAVAGFSAAGQWTLGLLLFAGATFLVGGQLLAIAQIRICNRWWLDWAADAWPLPVIVYFGRFGWLAMTASRATWTPAWKEVRDMASLDGAGRFQTAVQVVWPLAWPILIAGALLVGALSLTEVPATVLLQPSNPQVLTPTLMTWLHQQRSDDMIKASLLMMITVLLPGLGGVILTAVGLRISSLRAMQKQR
jgi:ABC-type Fe3+ transport system permease subunit